MNRLTFCGVSFSVLTFASVYSVDAKLLLTEYREPSSLSTETRLLELTNVGSQAIDTGDFLIKKVTNGAGGESTGLQLVSKQLDPFESYVIAYTGSGVIDLASSLVDQLSSQTELAFGGDDTINLYEFTGSGLVLIDSFGDRLGDPGTEWNVNGVGTRNTILRRRFDFTRDTDLFDPFDPSDQWIPVADTSDVSDFGRFVPEPSSLALLGLAGLLVARRRRS